MTKDKDGFVILDNDDMCGVNALIATLDMHSRDKGSYTIQEASRFVREWEYIRRPHAREFNRDFEDDEC
jgi:hypothetical protein